MEITNFLTWFVCIGLMASVGISAMIYAYRGQGTISVLFTQPILISSQTMPFKRVRLTMLTYLQGSAKRLWPGLVNFVAAIAYQLC